MMTSSQVAARLGVGTAAVRMLVQRGALTPARPGARPLRFPEAEVWRLEQRRMTPTQVVRIRDLWAEVDARLASDVNSV